MLDVSARISCMTEEETQNEIAEAVRVYRAVRDGGRKGGPSRSKKKLAAVRRNIKLATAARLKNPPRKKQLTLKLRP